MKDRLEQFTQQNKEAFDMHEPDAKVWQYIKNATIVEKKHKLSWVKYAAAVIIFVVGFSIGKEYKNLISVNGSNNGGNVKSLEQTQLIESEYYYTTKINDKLLELEPYFATDPKLKHDIEIDFEQLDEFYMELKTDLNDNINNENVIEAMIQSYEMKLEILEGLLKQLKQNDHEKAEIEI